MTYLQVHSPTCPNVAAENLGAFSSQKQSWTGLNGVSHVCTSGVRTGERDRERYATRLISVGMYAPSSQILEESFGTMTLW
jgi:hypothetical protein